MLGLDMFLIKYWCNSGVTGKIWLKYGKKPLLGATIVQQTQYYLVQQNKLLGATIVQQNKLLGATIVQQIILCSITRKYSHYIPEIAV